MREDQGVLPMGEPRGSRFEALHKGQPGHGPTNTAMRPPQRIGIPKSDSGSTFDEADSIDSMQQSLSSFIDPAKNGSCQREPSRGVRSRDSVSTLGDESVCSYANRQATRNFAVTKTSGSSRDSLKHASAQNGTKKGFIAKIANRRSLAMTRNVMSSKHLLEDERKDELPVLPTRLASSHSKSASTLSSIGMIGKASRGKVQSDVIFEDERDQQSRGRSFSNLKARSCHGQGLDSSPGINSTISPGGDRRSRSRSQPRNERKSRSKSISKSSDRQRGSHEKAPRRKSYSRSSSSRRLHLDGSGSTHKINYPSKKDPNSHASRPGLGRRSSSERILSSTRPPRSKSIEPHRAKEPKHFEFASPPHRRPSPPRGERSSSRSPKQNAVPPRRMDSTNVRPSLTKKYGSEKGLEAALHDSQRNLIKQTLSKRQSERTLVSKKSPDPRQNQRPSLLSNQFISERNFESVSRQRSRSASRPRNTLRSPNHDTALTQPQSAASPALDSSIEALEERLRSTRWYHNECPKPTETSPTPKTQRCHQFCWSDQ